MFRALNMKLNVLYDVISSSLVCGILKMLVPIHQTTWCYILEDHNLTIASVITDILGWNYYFVFRHEI